MEQYAVDIVFDGRTKYYYIIDRETMDIALLPTKYLKHKVNSNISPNTIKRYAFSLCYYMTYLNRKLSFYEVCQLDFEEQSNHFTQFLYWLKNGFHTNNNSKKIANNGTCNAYLKDVFRFYLFLSECNYVQAPRVLSFNQIAMPNAVGIRRILRSRAYKGYLKAPEPNVRAAEEDEILKTLQACTNSRDKLLILLLAETGFRIGEILGVDYSRDIDYYHHTIGVYFRDDNKNEVRAKNAEFRKAKISDDTFDFLLHYLAEYRMLLQQDRYLFINISGDTAGQPLNVDSVYAMLLRISKKTEIELTPHMLRRYYAVSRWEAGWPLELISQALGHKHLDTTLRYLGILDTKLIEASREFYTKHTVNYGIDRLLGGDNNAS